MLAALWIRQAVLASYKNPGSQMLSTVLPGEYLLVNQLAYGFKVPYWHNKQLSMRYLYEHAPQRYDVLVYRHQGKTLLGRCIGLPGDTIEQRGSDLYLNGNKRLSHPYTSLPYAYPSDQEEQIQQSLNKLSISTNKPIRGQELTVRYLNQYQYFVLNSYLQPQLELQAAPIDTTAYRVVVPDNSYWILGDKPDTAIDSRHLGFIPHNDLQGRAALVWLSIDHQQSPRSALRFHRLFKFIH